MHRNWCTVHVLLPPEQAAHPMSANQTLRGLADDAAHALAGVAYEPVPRGRRKRREWVRLAQVHMAGAAIVLELTSAALPRPREQVLSVTADPSWRP